MLAPGFWRVRLARENLFLATHFARRGYDVAALDFRGHGESGGGYSFGATEHHDFQAVLDELVGDGKMYERFSVLGLSMGGSIAAQALALRPDQPCRALAMISSPADLRALRPKPWRLGALKQLQWKHALKVPKFSGRRLTARRPRAEDAMASLPMPKLIVTAEGDWLVDPSHGRALARAAARARRARPPRSGRLAARGRAREFRPGEAVEAAGPVVPGERAAVATTQGQIPSPPVGGRG